MYGIATLVAGTLLASCTDGAAPPDYDRPRDADRAIVRMTTEITADGRRALRVEADSAFFDTGSDMTLIGVRASMFAATGITAVTIEADSGRLDADTRRLTALGTVIANTRGGGITVRTSALVYDPSTGRLTSDSATVVDRGASTEQGPCFDGNALLTQWTLCSGPP